MWFRPGHLGVWLVLLTPICTRAADAPAAPTTKPGEGKLPFIQVDVKKKQVRVACEACSENMDVGLEFFCVGAGTNEYESVLRTKAKASHLHLALLMIGLEPGEPVRYSEAAKKWLPPHGPPLQITCEWKDPKKDEIIRAPAYRLMRSIKEKKKELAPFTWIFSGSKIMEDGKYAADTVGYFVSVLNNELSVIDVSQLASRDLESRQLERNTDLLPPTGTEIWMIIEPAGTGDGHAAPPATQPGPKGEVPAPGPANAVATPPDAEAVDLGQTLVSVDDKGAIQLDGMTVPLDRLKPALSDRRVKAKVKLMTTPNAPSAVVGRVIRAMNIAKTPFDAADADTASLVALAGAADKENHVESQITIDNMGLITFNEMHLTLHDLAPVINELASPDSTQAHRVKLLIDPGARRDVVTKVIDLLEAADVTIDQDKRQQLTDVGIDDAKVKSLRQKWEKIVAPHNAALKEAAQAHYEVIESLRREQQRLIDEADRIQRVIDQLQKEYSDMTTPRPQGQ